MREFILEACGHAITVELNYRENGTASDLWDCSIVLARYFEKQQQKLQPPQGKGDALPLLLAGKRVVELGAGVGALGLLAAKLGARECFLTDLPAACGLLRKNVARNTTSEGARRDHCEVVPLVWGDEHLPAEIARHGPVDLVLGSDLLLPFAPELFAPLCSTIRVLLAPAGRALIAYEERFDCADFFAQAEACGLAVEWVSNEDLHPQFRDPGRIHVFRLRIAAAGGGGGGNGGDGRAWAAAS